MCKKCFIYLLFSPLLMAGNNLLAKGKERVGFVTNYNDNVQIQLFNNSFTGLFRNLDININTNINISNYEKLKKQLGENNIQLVRINNITKEKMRLFDKEYYGSADKRRVFLGELKRQYNINKIIVLAEERVANRHRYHVVTQYFERDEIRNHSLKWCGFYFINGSYTNWKMKKENPFFSYMSGRLYVYDLNKSKQLLLRDYKHIKEVEVVKIYDDELRNKIFNFVIKDVEMESKVIKYKYLVYEKKINKKKLRELYTEENGSLDEYFDLVYELDELTFERYERVENFKVLTEPVKNNMRSFLEIAQDYILKSVAQDVLRVLNQGARTLENDR